MKCKTDSMLLPDNPSAIRNTEELSAKKLLVYFLETFDTMDELFNRTKAMQALEKLLDEKEKSEAHKEACCMLYDLTAEICSCFCRFLAESPHVHVTID